MHSEKDKRSAIDRVAKRISDNSKKSFDEARKIAIKSMIRHDSKK